MTIILPDRSKEDLKLIQPYYSQKQQARILGLSVNTMIKIREQIGLPKKDKGRPKGNAIVFKGDQQYPQAILDAVERLKKDIVIAKMIASKKEESKKQEFIRNLRELTKEEIDKLIQEFINKNCK